MWDSHFEYGRHRETSKAKDYRLKPHLYRLYTMHYQTMRTDTMQFLKTHLFMGSLSESKIQDIQILNLFSTVYIIKLPHRFVKRQQTVKYNCMHMYALHHHSALTVCVRKLFNLLNQCTMWHL